MPAPEEMVDPGGPAEARRPEGPRPGFEDTIWFRMDIGRRHNADPRWLPPLLCRRGRPPKPGGGGRRRRARTAAPPWRRPLLCRRGHTPKPERGAIRIAAGETMFEVPRVAAGRFM